MIRNTNEKAQFQRNYIIISPKIYWEQSSTQAYLGHLDKKNKSKYFWRKLKPNKKKLLCMLLVISYPKPILNTLTTKWLTHYIYLEQYVNVSAVEHNNLSNLEKFAKYFFLFL